ncbi:hypothetical protein HGRIS_010203 [Hohenbuehelia grisea]|uniref:Uncharacterized protein n=1 Tax=Hohenbuehelia grisea TaxID=104357 RepID=A0ABR3J3L0_9AGAR
MSSATLVPTSVPVETSTLVVTRTSGTSIVIVTSTIAGVRSIPTSGSSAIVVTSTIGPVESNSPHQTKSPSPLRKRTVGGVVGGILSFIVLAVGFYCLITRRRRQALIVVTAPVEPFNAPPLAPPPRRTNLNLSVPINDTRSGVLSERGNDGQKAGRHLPRSDAAQGHSRREGLSIEEADELRERVAALEIEIRRTQQGGTLQPELDDEQPPSYASKSDAGR